MQYWANKEVIWEMVNPGGSLALKGTYTTNTATQPNQLTANFTAVRAGDSDWVVPDEGSVEAARGIYEFLSNTQVRMQFSTSGDRHSQFEDSGTVFFTKSN